MGGENEDLDVAFVDTRCKAVQGKTACNKVNIQEGCK